MKKMKKACFVIGILFVVNTMSAQYTENYYKIGVGIDIGFRLPYANNNWLPGIASGLRFNASKRFSNWEPELYFKKNIFNLTDIVEYHDAKSIEYGVNGIYHLNNEHHVFLGGIGLNRVSYQLYDYNETNGWSEKDKREIARRFVYQIGYRFNFRKNKLFDPGITISYHNIRKFQLGIDLSYKIK